MFLTIAGVLSAFLLGAIVGGRLIAGGFRMMIRSGEWRVICHHDKDLLRCDRCRIEHRAGME